MINSVTNLRKRDFMDTNVFSLLHPKARDTHYNKLTDEAINDLSVDFLCEALSEDDFERNNIKQLLVNLPNDEETIRYRCDVFEDFLRFPKLREDLTRVLAKLKDLREIERFQKDGESSSLWQLVNRLRELDGYVDCITEIKNTLETLDINSQGLKILREKVTAMYSDRGFPELKEDITETLKEVRKVKSITLGVNLDDMLKPHSVGVISLNDKHFTDTGLLKKFVNFASKQEELHHGTDVSDLTSFHPANPSVNSMKIGFSKAVIGAQKDVSQIYGESLTGADPMSDALKKVVTDILKRTVNNLKSMLNKYVGVSGYSFVSLMPEILFYIRFAELCDKIKAKGLPLCKAEILPKEERSCNAKDLYNLKLAIRAIRGENDEIVKNDFSFDDEKRIYILTGPNRGGKTTITQAVGLVFLLAQNGIYVPCTSVKLSPCDNIFTHFPADENDTVDLGRLGEESKRLADIFSMASSHSLLLLNESLATTNVSEGLYIARDVLKSMRYLGVRAIFNTHMHDLARNLKELNEETQGDSIVESMVTGVENGSRSFKIFISPPQGISYAKDIALKYGVTFESIRRKIDNKKTNHA